MSKNALVLDDHYGDNGAVTAGMILRNITSTRFNELEKKGLIREASAEEVKAGDKHAFEKDTTGEQAGGDDDGGEAADRGGEKKAPESSNKKAPEAKNKEA